MPRPGLCSYAKASPPPNGDTARQGLHFLMGNPVDAPRASPVPSRRVRISAAWGFSCGVHVKAVRLRGHGRRTAKTAQRLKLGAAVPASMGWLRGTDTHIQFYGEVVQLVERAEQGTATACIAGLPCVIGWRRFDSAGESGLHGHTSMRVRFPPSPSSFNYFTGSIDRPERRA